MAHDATARSAAGAGSSDEQTSPLHAVISRRAVSRRFSCPLDPSWRRLRIALVGAAVGAAALACLQHGAPLAAAAALAVVLGACASGIVAKRLPAHGDTLRWDGAQWWWQPLADFDIEPGAGSRLANQVAKPVVPVVLIDVERWMLIRLAPVDASWRFWRHHHLAVSRRGMGSAWPLLRIHLFMA